MKLGRNLAVLAIASTSLGLGTAAMAQGFARHVPFYSQNVETTPVAQYNHQLPQQQNKRQTFTGTVEKSSDGSYVLEVGGKNFRLDDSKLAAKYVGKQVKVTGVLDSNTDTIHVTSIKPV